MILPEIHSAQPLSMMNADRVLILAEGFEPRSLHWIKNQPKEKLFTYAIICRYSPSEGNRFAEIEHEVLLRTVNTPIVIEYNRFEPTAFEQEFGQKLSLWSAESLEIDIDISAMSKMLIMIIINSLRNNHNNLRILYTEPTTWKPSEDEYRSAIENIQSQGSRIALSSIGVFDIARTPRLASVVMQGAPILLVAFTSSNEQTLSALLNEVMPASTLLINAKNNREPWREDATLQINQRVIRDFYLYKYPIDSLELLDYVAVFEYLAETYRANCYSKRIVLSPTGGKIHTVACALIKTCCQDIHVEYPTPESYHIEGYSSSEINATHEIFFPNFKALIKELTSVYKLNG